MVFGYLIVRTLIPLVHLLGRWGRSKRFAASLNAARRPFHVVNYLGSLAGGQVVSACHHGDVDAADVAVAAAAVGPGV